MNLKPRCTIATSWTGTLCNGPAIARNHMGGYECEFHHSLHDHPNLRETYLYNIARFGKMKEIKSDTFIGKIHLQIVYLWKMLTSHS